jgi:hypothetical protein
VGEGSEERVARASSVLVFASCENELSNSREWEEGGQCLPWLFEHKQSLFRQNAETSTLEACAPRTHC